jgi:hypothetical protein
MAANFLSFSHSSFNSLVFDEGAQNAAKQSFTVAGITAQFSVCHSFPTPFLFFVTIA